MWRIILILPEKPFIPPCLSPLRPFTSTGSFPQFIRTLLIFVLTLSLIYGTLPYVARRSSHNYPLSICPARSSFTLCRSLQQERSASPPFSCVCALFTKTPGWHQERSPLALDSPNSFVCCISKKPEASPSPARNPVLSLPLSSFPHVAPVISRCDNLPSTVAGGPVHRVVPSRHSSLATRHCLWGFYGHA